jgi:hypothetical protein
MKTVYIPKPTWREDRRHCQDCFYFIPLTLGCVKRIQLEKGSLCLVKISSSEADQLTGSAHRGGSSNEKH